jgi:Ca2+-binding RTX toxin-like protein
VFGEGGNDFLQGGGGNDLVSGGAGDDTLVAGDVTLSKFPVFDDGFVTLDGDAGNDELRGGIHTTYLIQAGEGNDTLFDYRQGGIVAIDGFAIGDRQTLLSDVTFSGNVAVIDLQNGETLTFRTDIRTGPIPANYFDNVTFEFRNVQGGGGEPPPPAEEAARPTPNVPRSYVAPGADGVARGTAAADDIYATANGQTLIGGGGDDVFNIGTKSNLTIDASGPGISTVSTWFSDYTLHAGVDNLIANGSYGHRLTGNNLSNWISGTAGNDVIDGGVGNSFGGGGRDVLVGGGGDDVFVFRAKPFGDNPNDRITDFGDGDRLDVSDLASSMSQLVIGDDGQGNATVQVTNDTTQGGHSPYGPVSHIVTLDGVAAGTLTASDFIFV